MVGGELVRRLLDRHAARGGLRRDVYLLTLETTRGGYERLGFARVEEKADVPEQMRFEVAAGELVSALLGNRLVCMRGRDDD